MKSRSNRYAYWLPILTTFALLSVLLVGFNGGGALRTTATYKSFNPHRIKETADTVGGYSATSDASTTTTTDSTYDYSASYDTVTADSTTTSRYSDGSTASYTVVAGSVDPSEIAISDGGLTGTQQAQQYVQTYGMDANYTTTNATGSSSFTEGVYCQRGGCWFRLGDNEVRFYSTTVYYGLKSPDGTRTTLGHGYYYIRWWLTGAAHQTMHMNGHMWNTRGLYYLLFTGAMQNGEAGHSTGGSQISDICHDDTAWNTSPQTTIWPPNNNPYCVRSDQSQMDHNMTLQFTWALPSSSTVPEGLYWGCYTRSVVAHSNSGNNYWFRGLNSDYHGLTQSSIHCGVGESGAVWMG